MTHRRQSHKSTIPAQGDPHLLRSRPSQGEEHKGRGAAEMLEDTRCSLVQTVFSTFIHVHTPHTGCSAERYFTLPLSGINMELQSPMLHLHATANESRADCVAGRFFPRILLTCPQNERTKACNSGMLTRRSANLEG
jgi:hypothetical protein